MPNQLAKEMFEKKQKESSFANLKDDGDEITGIVKSMKNVTKTGFGGGEEIEVLRLVLITYYEDIGEVEKTFDNGSQKWLAELLDKDVDVGDKITITRHGEYKSNKTYYTIKMVSKKGQATDAEKMFGGQQVD